MVKVLGLQSRCFRFKLQVQPLHTQLLKGRAIFFAKYYEELVWWVQVNGFLLNEISQLYLSRECNVI
jgi:hypothetical protein